MATNLDDIAAIRAHFLNAWVPSHPGVPYVYDNEAPVDEPEGVWVRLSVSPGFQRRRSIFERTYEQFGRIYFQVFVPTGTDDEEGWPVADSFAALFRDWLSDNRGLYCETPEFSTSKVNNEPFMIVVSIPYRSVHTST